MLIYYHGHFLGVGLSFFKIAANLLTSVLVLSYCDIIGNRGDSGEFANPSTVLLSYCDIIGNRGELAILRDCSFAK